MVTRPADDARNLFERAVEARIELQAAAIAASAQIAGGIDADMPELPRTAGDARHHLAVLDDGAADADGRS